MHVAVILWGFTGVLGRAINLDAPILVWYRMLITAIIVLSLLIYHRQWQWIGLRDTLKLAIIGCLISLHWVAFYASIKLANISVALVCLSTAGVFTSLIDPYINKSKHDVQEIVLGLVAIVGVYFIYRSEVSMGAGIIFGLLAAILSSVFTVLNKKMTHRFPVRNMLFLEMTAGLIFVTLLLPFYLHFQPHAQIYPVIKQFSGGKWYENDWLWLFVMSLCCTVWAQSLALSALRHLSSFTATLSVNLEPIYGILLAFICFSENKEIIFVKGTTQVNYGFILGIGLIMITVVLQMMRVIGAKKWS